MAISLSEIKQYRALAARYPENVSAKIINHLLDELQKCRDEIITLRLKTADLRGEYNDWTPCPFGRHKGDALRDVPADWLNWWFTQNSDRSLIIFEMDYGDWPKRATAVKALRLHDYIKHKRNGDTIQDHWQEKSQEA